MKKKSKLGSSIFIDHVNIEYSKFIKPKLNLINKLIEDLSISMRSEDYISHPYKTYSGRIYYHVQRAKVDQPIIYLDKILDQNLVIDFNKYLKDKDTLSCYSFSDNTKYLAVTSTVHGSDLREIRVLDIKNKNFLIDRITGVKHSGAVWQKEGFYYTKFDIVDGKESFHSVYYHKLGTKQTDDILRYKSNEPDSFVQIYVDPESQIEILTLSNSLSQGNRLAISRSNSEEWFFIIENQTDFFYNYIQRFKDLIFLHTDINAPNGKIISINIKTMAQKDIILEDRRKILTQISCAGNKIFIHYTKDTFTEIDVYNRDFKFIKKLELPGIGAASVANNWIDSSESYFNYTDQITPDSVYKLDLKNLKYKIYNQTHKDVNPKEYIFEFKMVKNGKTEIPIYITYKKGLVLNSNNPTTLYIYGGFGVSISPGYSTARKVLLDNGGISVIAGIRGGGEYGETWHEQGKLHNKLNSLNDTIAVAEFLIKNNYTQKELLTINGESNGGMSVAAVANIRPDICYQVVAECGVYDLLNFHKYPPGFYWKSEYGDPEKKEDMEYIKRYSPLHTIKKDIKYPIIILKTAQNDDRVNPIHSWLFYEALKKAFLGTKNKVYLRVNEVGGHGGSSLTSFIQDTAEYYACVLSTDKDSKINTTSKIL